MKVLEDRQKQIICQNFNIRILNSYHGAFSSQGTIEKKKTQLKTNISETCNQLFKDCEMPFELYIENGNLAIRFTKEIEKYLIAKLNEELEKLTPLQRIALERYELNIKELILKKELDMNEEANKLTSGFLSSMVETNIKLEKINFFQAFGENGVDPKKILLMKEECDKLKSGKMDEKEMISIATSVGFSLANTLNVINELINKSVDQTDEKFLKNSAKTNSLYLSMGIGIAMCSLAVAGLAITAVLVGEGIFILPVIVIPLVVLGVATAIMTSSLIKMNEGRK